MNHFIMRKNNIDIDRRQLLLLYSRINKYKQTESERLLWKKIRYNKLGWEFEQQYRIPEFYYRFDYKVDFICHEKNLIIEVDGKYHESKYYKERDSIRTKVLKGRGYKVIRFTNEQVKTNITEVIEDIKNKLNEIW